MAKHPGGRPREWDREQIAKDMIEWARRDDSINLNKFCATFYEDPIPPSKITIWAKECAEFRKAYESAKAYLGFRREEKLAKNEIHVKAYDLNAQTYDAFLRDERRAQAEFEAKLKAQESEQVDAEHKAKADQILSQLSSMQEQIARKR